MKTVLLLLISIGLVYSAAFNRDAQKHWVVLIAGSDGWYNYRHQADVCHAYQVVRKHGIPASNIITFMVDDIAANRNNPFPGKIFNDYQKQDVYAGVEIDYKGPEVTPEMFLRVLKGDQELKANGKKVLESGPEDNVFIYFSDHGAPGLIAFPESELYAEQLNETFTYMHKNKRYNEMVVYIEACESGSMFDGILSEKMNIYATTAANPDESSYAAFCSDSQLDTCLADEYSYNWITDSEKHDFKKWTFNDQFEAIKKQTKGSHVMRYGDLDLGKLKLDEFEGSDDVEITQHALPDTYANHRSHRTSSRRAHLVSLTRKVLEAKTEEEHQTARRKLNRAVQLGEIAKQTIDDIVSHMRTGEARNARRVSKHEELRCFREVYSVFKTKCFTIQQVPEVASHLSKLNTLCKSGYDSSEIIQSVLHICA